MAKFSHQHLLWTAALWLVLIVRPSTSGKNKEKTADLDELKDLPLGYFAFEKASPRYGSPPQVRKPPYLPTQVPCEGDYDSQFSPKFTLCGDLNKGFIPKNPMGHNIHGQPYPFEVIKNKTLQFLARSLPILKQEVDVIPKVARFGRGPQRETGGYDMQHTNPFFHYLIREKRSAPSKSDPKPSHNHRSGSSSAPAHVHTFSSAHAPSSTAKPSSTEAPISSSSPTYFKPLSKSSDSSSSSSSGSSSASAAAAAANNLSKYINAANLKKAERRLNETLGRACEGNTGMFCQVVQAFGGTKVSDGLLGTLSQAAQVMSAANTAANAGAAIGSIAGLISDYTNKNNGEGTGPSLSSLVTPLSSLIDYFSGSGANSVEKSDRVFMKRKRPADPQDLLAEAQIPPTPCPSIEEYVSPTFARNYQGVWKYVVQIPHEGYFTQTVQKTTCAKQRCDFTDGACHESPRWVSLLVAEIFYPNTYVPSTQTGLDAAIAAASEAQQASTQFNQQQSSSAFNSDPLQMTDSMTSYSYFPYEDYSNYFQQAHYGHPHGQHHQHHGHNHYFQRRQGQGSGPVYVPENQFGFPNMFKGQQPNPAAYRQQPAAPQQAAAAQPQPVQQSAPVHHPQQQTHTKVYSAHVAAPQQAASSRSYSVSSTPDKDIFTPRRFKRQSESTSSTENKPTDGENSVECDGYDKIGCYQVRIYYDWFLVNGSCKCWKPRGTGQGGALESIKRIFIGK